MEGSGSHDRQLPDYQQQWMQYYNQYGGVPGYHTPHGQPVQPQEGVGQGVGFGPAHPQQEILLRVRVITGEDGPGRFSLVSSDQPHNVS